MLDRESHGADAGCAGVSHLTKKSEELIYVKTMTTSKEQPAFELENPENPGEHSTVWVEWATTKKENIFLENKL